MKRRHVKRHVKHHVVRKVHHKRRKVLAPMRRTVRVPKRGIIIRVMPQRSTHTNKAYDRRVSAMKPGKRRSRNQRIYYERRANRSDKNKYL